MQGGGGGGGCVMNFVNQKPNFMTTRNALDSLMAGADEEKQN